ncbi:MAG: hypothetical protein EOM23_09540 [Candidatus Moranbacteria bacterium]|nr:hypothetical protein [Candidatus Moranbacteria bacterium]
MKAPWKFLYLVSYSTKVRDEKSDVEYRLVHGTATVRATSFKEAREKFRKRVSYDVSKIEVYQIRQTLFSKIRYFFRRNKK